MDFSRTFRKILRKAPSKLGCPAWEVLSTLKSGRDFFFPDQVGGLPVWWGGVFRFADFKGNIFRDLDSHEPETVAAMRALLGAAAAPVVLDVGANAGQYAAILKTFYPGARVHGFEPFARAVAFLEGLARKNGWKDVHFTRCLVGDREGTAPVYFTNPGECGSTADAAQSRLLGFKNSEEVPQITLDAYAGRTGLGEISLIKIDVEGAELEVLKGAASLLARTRPPVILEVLYSADPATRSRHEEIWRFFHALGYELSRIGEGGALELQKTPGPDPRFLLRNYLARPV